MLGFEGISKIREGSRAPLPRCSGVCLITFLVREVCFCGADGYKAGMMRR
jgi:hypothetical protein